MRMPLTNISTIGQQSRSVLQGRDAAGKAKEVSPDIRIILCDALGDEVLRTASGAKPEDLAMLSQKAGALRICAIFLLVCDGLDQNAVPPSFFWRRGTSLK